MSRDQATSIATDLIAHGRAPSTPAWVVGAATTLERCSTCFTLQQMANDTAAKWISAEHPSLLMIGGTLVVRTSATASEPALDTHPHSLAVWVAPGTPALFLTPPSSRGKNPPRYSDDAVEHEML